MREKTAGYNNLNRTFGHTGKLDRLQALVPEVSIVEVTGNLVKVAGCSYPDYLIARSTLKKEGYETVREISS